MNHIYASVNDLYHNSKNKGVDGRLKYFGYVKHLPQKSWIAVMASRVSSMGNN